MSDIEVELTAVPDDCDAAGTVSHAAFLRLFERARWEQLRRGPGVDVFDRQGVWPAVRRSVLEFHTPVRPGETLRFTQHLTHLGRTSFTLRQNARRATDGVAAASAEFLFVCLDRQGQPQPVPEDVGRFFSARASSEPVDRVTVNGVSLAIETRGSGPAVVFIHGFPLDRSIWRHPLDTLTGFRRIALDLRGMGQSDAPDLGYSMAMYADDLAALIDALGEDRVVLCGLSMGGYVAFEFLRRYRARVRGLILMDTRAEADSAEGRKARDMLVTRVREQGAIAAAEAMLPRFFTAGVPPEIIQSVREMILRTPVPGIVGALTAMRDRPDSSPLLATLVGVPTLVVVGEEDVITPPSISRSMATTIPEARFVEIPGAGHLPIVEQPVPTTRAVLKFLQSLR
ncbi:MAG: alpha/beta fold hydrolase [Gemmatimonadales bacterium]|nr:alpha/beta fold hydrolase [Gemmatimonadota bacterium]MCC7133668.1 alpha/beta fold hydrolase [Gemmatimonadales bacterium]MDX2058785.1 alpha/beta fold hydrolase [Gemmatimonadales bacterium]